jgi:hypothetical protein
VVRATTVVMQWSGKHASSTIERLCFLRGPCRRVILETIGATVSWGRSVEELRVESSVVLASGQQRDHGSWRISIAKIRYQKTSIENIPGGIAIVESCYQVKTSESRLGRLSVEWLVVWKSAIILQLFVVTTCKWSIILFTNPYPV